LFLEGIEYKGGWRKGLSSWWKDMKKMKFGSTSY